MQRDGLKTMKYLISIFILCGMAAFAQNFPGQSGNPVGYAAWGNGTLSTASCPGSWTSGTSANPTVYSVKCTTSQTISGNYIICNLCDFSGGVTVSGTNISFPGTRFQSNAVGSYNVVVTGQNIYFPYSSFTPLASLLTSPPCSTTPTWPSCGAGQNSTTITSGVNACPYADSYQYAIGVTGSSAGPIWVDHADMWCFGNAIDFIAATTAQMTVTNSWCHDGAYNNGALYHTDCMGYLNGGAAPSNILLAGNTMATLGNTHDIAMQEGTSGYSNIIALGNYLSGNQYAASWCAPTGVDCSNSTFSANIRGTDIMPEAGGIYPPFALGSNSSFACNTINFLGGTTWTDAAGWTPLVTMQGQFWAPTNATANSATDYLSNTICPVPSTYSFDYQNQATSTTSASKSVTMTSTASGTVTGLYASLVTGTQYAIASNTCGTSGSPITLASNATCTVTVTFTPTSLGPKTDTLNFTSTNSPASLSPTPVTLIGVGCTAGAGCPSSGASFTCSPSTVPANHSGHIVLTCTGVGTSWTGSTAFSVSGVSGTSYVSTSNSSSTSQTVTITTGSGTGTLTVSDTTDSINTTIAVATATLSISPTSGNVGTAPSETLTGTNTLWSTETASTLFSVSGAGCSGEVLGTITVSSNISASAALFTGRAPCTITFTDNSTTATATFTVTAIPYPVVPAPLFQIDMNTTAALTLLNNGFGCIRIWDTPSSTWALINTASTTFTWTSFDTVMANAYNAGVPCAEIDLARTPVWASSAPTDSSCNGGETGECDPPNDINPDGTGTNDHWREWIAQLFTHATAAGYTNSHATLGYTELWNEVSACGFWNSAVSPCTGTGTMNQLSRMQWDEYCIVKGAPASQPTNPFTGETCPAVWASITQVSVTGPLAPTVQIGMPSFLPSTTSITQAQNFLYANNSPPTNNTIGAAGWTDFTNFHFKPGNPAVYGSASTVMETVLTNYRNQAQAIMQPAELAKPLFNTEGGYATAGFQDCTVTSGAPPYCNYSSSNDMQQSFTARFYIWCSWLGFQVCDWYDWTAGLPTTPTFATSAAGALVQTFQWIAGGNNLNCTTSAPGTAKAGLNTITCTFTGPSGVAEAFIWDNSQECASGSCTTTNQTVASNFTSYFDLAGDPPVPIIGNTVPVGIKPLLLVGPISPRYSGVLLSQLDFYFDELEFAQEGY